jgi:hypothetical protein
MRSDMAKVVVDISMSLDGFVAGPDDGLGRGLGEGGEPIHNWVMGGPWTYRDGPRFQSSGVDREVLDETFAAAGAIIVGRRMYDLVGGWARSPCSTCPCSWSPAVRTRSGPWGRPATRSYRRHPRRTRAGPGGRG